MLQNILKNKYILIGVIIGTIIMVLSIISILMGTYYANKIIDSGKATQVQYLYKHKHVYFKYNGQKYSFRIPIHFKIIRRIIEKNRWEKKEPKIYIYKGYVIVSYKVMFFKIENNNLDRYYNYFKKAKILMDLAS